MERAPLKLAQCIPWGNPRIVSLSPPGTYGSDIPDLSEYQKPPYEEEPFAQSDLGHGDALSSSFKAATGA
jgi:hypothetical protein